MPKKIENFRDTVGAALARSKEHMVETLRKKMGPPPSSVAARAQKDDVYRAYWQPAPGWEDSAAAEQKAAAMYAQGAKPADVLKAMYPMRVELLVLGDRRDNLGAQVQFCDEMVAKHMEELAGKAVALRDQMEES